jgi:dTDP-4-dehydrorhamnose 3,5-epimerase
MPIIEESKTIAGVYIVRLKAMGDDRGRFMETFRKSWFPQRSWESVQVNRSDSAAGVLRGLHFHHKQVDYWYLMRGQVRAGLVDLRRRSPTHLAAQTVDMGDGHTMGLFVPIGVAHGFAAHTDATLFYIVDNYYDGADEFGVRWDDPAFGLDWGIENPTLSARDAGNPLLVDLPQEHLPD